MDICYANTIGDSLPLVDSLGTVLRYPTRRVDLIITQVISVFSIPIVKCQLNCTRIIGTARHFQRTTQEGGSSIAPPHSVMISVYWESVQEAIPLLMLPCDAGAAFVQVTVKLCAATPPIGPT